MGNTCTCVPCDACTNKEPEEFNLDDLDKEEDPMYKKEMLSTGFNSELPTAKGLGSGTFQAWANDGPVEAPKYVWNCPGYDSDDEIDELKRLQNPTEVQQRVKFSQKGMIEYIERLLSLEQSDGPDESIA